MGWLYFNADRSENRKEIVTNYIECERLKVLYSACQGSVVYCSVFDNKKQETFAVVALTSWRYNNGVSEFGIKTIDETMGPYYFDAPLKLIHMLSPTNNEFANIWRKKCINYQKTKNLSVTLPSGTKIKLHDEYGTLVYIQEFKKKRSFVTFGIDGKLYRMPSETVYKCGFDIV